MPIAIDFCLTSIDNKPHGIILCCDECTSSLSSPMGSSQGLVGHWSEQTMIFHTLMGSMYYIYILGYPKVYCPVNYILP